jgi:hypothetical protein
MADTATGLSLQVAVLFAKKHSIYNSFAYCDVWDKERDALKWPGGMPLVSTPALPCLGTTIAICQSAPRRKRTCSVGRGTSTKIWRRS